MLTLDTHLSGRHFLQVPGPTNVPDRVLRAISYPTIDHRGPEFAKMTLEILENLKKVIQTKGTVVIFGSSATGAWEAALTNTLSSGDKILMFETGHFSTLWKEMAKNFGLVVDFVPGDWQRGVDAAVVEAKLAEDKNHAIKAVCVVHNETSTGVTSKLYPVRQAIDKARHPALFMVDTVSSLASIDYRHDEWGVDVMVVGSQKGLMLPPGVAFNAISNKALAASKKARLPRSYWDWDAIMSANASGFFPYTPSTNLLFGLHESLAMLLEEGLPAVFARHARLAEATRKAVTAWGLEMQCKNRDEYSNTLTAVVMPDGKNADTFRSEVLRDYNLSLGAGLGLTAGKVFRIGHLGFFNDLMLCATLSGVELGLKRTGGVQAALDHLQQHQQLAAV